MTSSAPEPRWLSEDEQRHWRAYLRGSRLLEAALDRDLQSQGVQLSEYELISMLSEAPAHRLRMSVLADLIVQSRSRVTHTAARLENRGWVQREACLDDRRGVELVLTEDGMRAVEKMAKVHVDSVRRHLLDAMPEQQFAQLGAAMQRVRERVAGEGEIPGGMAD